MNGDPTLLAVVETLAAFFGHDVADLERERLVPFQDAGLLPWHQLASVTPRQAIALLLGVAARPLVGCPVRAAELFGDMGAVIAIEADRLDTMRPLRSVAVDSSRCLGVTLATEIRLSAIPRSECRPDVRIVSIGLARTQSGIACSVKLAAAGLPIAIGFGSAAAPGPARWVEVDGAVIRRLGEIFGPARQSALPEWAIDMCVARAVARAESDLRAGMSKASAAAQL